MDIAIFTQAAQLGGTVFTVVIFLWYLTMRDNKWTDSLKDNSTANIALAKALQRLTDTIEANSRVNASNTDKIDENVKAVGKNTEVVDKNTEATIKNGNSKH